MCGVTRLSVTLAVILFELTGSLEHVLPFSLGVLEARHKELVAATIGPVMVEGIPLLPTIHWWRVTLATALMSIRNADGSMRDGVVQAHLRWRTVQAMEIYARYTPVTYAAEVSEALARGASTVVELPIIDPADAWASMNETAD